jgi:hypothetical protein
VAYFTLSSKSSKSASSAASVAFNYKQHLVFAETLATSKTLPRSLPKPVPRSLRVLCFLFAGTTHAASSLFAKTFEFRVALHDMGLMTLRRFAVSVGS